MADRCLGRNKDGGACSAQPPPGAGHCLWHDPARETERATWRRRGGAGRSTANRAAKRLPKSLGDVQGTLLRALAAVEAGELEPARANAMGALARAIVTVSEYGTLEERIAALEAATSVGGGRAS